MSDILDKTRRAFVAYITAGNVGTANIYDAKRAGEKSAPMVGCDATEATQDPPGLGNFWVDAEVVVKSIGAVDADAVDPKTAGDALTANVIALLEIDNDSLIAALSSQIAGFTVMGFGEEKSLEQSFEGDVWVTTWRRRIYCGGF
jgi:hypothetical protein